MKQTYELADKNLGEQKVWFMNEQFWPRVVLMYFNGAHCYLKETQPVKKIWNNKQPKK